MSCVDQLHTYSLKVQHPYFQVITMKVGDEEKEGFEINDFKGKFSALKKLWNAATIGFNDDDKVTCKMSVLKIKKKGE